MAMERILKEKRWRNISFTFVRILLLVDTILLSAVAATFRGEFVTKYFTDRSVQPEQHVRQV